MTESDIGAPTVVVQLLIDWLREANYRAGATSDGHNVVSGTSGLNFFIGIYDTSIQFVMGMTLDHDAVSFSDCNDQNRNWRFTKVYLDSDGNLSVEMDVLIVPTRDDAKVTFLQALSLWDSALGRVKVWIAGLPAAS